MSMWKNAAVRCLLLVTELLIVFLTADILWQLLCSRPPFSLPVFLLSGGLMTAGNALFRRRPRLFWQVLALNLLLCALWIPLLSATLDLTYPPLLVIQVPLYLFPLCRGIHWGTAPAALRQVRSAGEYMALYALFYLIVASFATQLLFRVPAVLAVLAADLLAAVAMRTAGRNTIRAGAPSLSRLPALLLPAALFCAAAGICAALLALRGELIPLVRAAGAILQQGLQAVVQLLLSLFAGRSSTAGETLAAGGGGSASAGALPETDAGPGIDPQLLAALLGLALAALLILAAAALIRWLWRNRRRVLSSGEDGGAEDLTRTSLRRPGPLQRLRRWLRLRSFLLRRAGSPRAALLQLERWGVRRRCIRQSRETPREYLDRLEAGPLAGLLDPEQCRIYRQLAEDVDRDLYGGLPARLTREQVRDLLAAIRRARSDQPPASP